MNSRKTPPTRGLVAVAIHVVLGFIWSGFSVLGAKLLMNLTSHQALYFKVVLPVKLFPKASAFGVVAYIVRSGDLGECHGMERMHLYVARGAEGVEALDSILCDRPPPTNAIQRFFSWVDAFGGFTDFKGHYEDNRSRYSGCANPEKNDQPMGETAGLSEPFDHGLNSGPNSSPSAGENPSNQRNDRGDNESRRDLLPVISKPLHFEPNVERRGGLQALPCRDLLDALLVYCFKT